MEQLTVNLWTQLCQQTQYHPQTDP